MFSPHTMHHLTGILTVPKPIDRVTPSPHDDMAFQGRRDLPSWPPSTDHSQNQPIEEAQREHLFLTLSLFDLKWCLLCYSFMLRLMCAFVLECVYDHFPVNWFCLAVYYRSFSHDLYFPALSYFSDTQHEKFLSFCYFCCYKYTA